MVVIAAVAGYLVGSAPTAIWLARLWGVDLTTGGTGNPGANNARRLGGPKLALLVLVVEMAKGVAAVLLGQSIAGEAGALAAGIGAVAGNVYNVWLGFKGGKGLGISGGVLLGLWPAGWPFIVLTLALAAAVTRSTGIGTLITIAALLVGALSWEQTGLENPWGISDPSFLIILAVALAVIVGPKHLVDARRRLSSPAPRRST
jgi:acyl phosphate:glycerol-3-phosphate acyltransferase